MYLKFIYINQGHKLNAEPKDHNKQRYAGIKNRNVIVMSRGHQFKQKKGRRGKKQKHDSRRFHQCISEQTKEKDTKTNEWLKNLNKPSQNQYKNSSVRTEDTLLFFDILILGNNLVDFFLQIR